MKVDVEFDSSGSPQIPAPVMRIAPKLTRLIVLLPARSKLV